MNKKSTNTVAVVAVRAGSQRVPNKNIRPFGDTTLLDLKLNVLKNTSGLNEIIVNTDSKDMIEIARKHGVSYMKRDRYFASSEATNSEFHRHIAEVTNADNIFLAPVCSPFISARRHSEIIKIFHESKCDSVTSTTPIIGHLWKDGSPLNYDRLNVPNSQDLPFIEMLNYGISLITRDSMLEVSGLVGLDPKFMNLSFIESIDINEMEEFRLAESLYSAGIISPLW